MDPVLPAAVACAFAIALATTPAGVSGAVFLLPVQVSVLGVPTPAVTPTNLIYNLIATPGAILPHWRRGALDLRLAAGLAAWAVPGVAAGAVLRVEVLPGRRAVLVLIGVVLSALGAWLLVGRAGGSRAGSPGRAVRAGVAAAAGMLGGAYGIGGGAVIAPALGALGLPARRVAPAALATTLVTSVAGVVAFEMLALARAGTGPVAPRWDVGVALGIGGALGGLAGARLSARMDERLLRRGLGAVALAVGAVHLAAAAAG